MFTTSSIQSLKCLNHLLVKCLQFNHPQILIATHNGLQSLPVLSISTHLCQSSEEALGALSRYKLKLSLSTRNVITQQKLQHNFRSGNTVISDGVEQEVMKISKRQLLRAGFPEFWHPVPMASSGRT